MMLKSLRRTGDPESGRIGILVMGMLLIAVLLMGVGIDITAAHLVRLRLQDAADASARDAADSVDPSAVRDGGLGAAVPLTDEGVRTAAVTHLARTARPDRVTDWGLGEPTGTPDGRVAQVTVVGHVNLPLSGGLVRLVGGDITITVTSRARSDVTALP